MRGISWRWVLTGIILIYGAQLLLAVGGRLLGDGIEPLQFHQALFLGFTLSSFLLGGFVVGLLSPGTTIVEPPLAALGAALLDALFPPFSALQMAAGPWLLIVTIGFHLALLGGWLGKRLPDVDTPRVLFWFALVVLAFGAPGALLALGLSPWIAAGLLATTGAFIYWRLMRAGLQAS